MRVITGTARGKKLMPLSGDDVRPTSDRIKEAVFSIIQFDVIGRSFLDLFAGTGQMGIEALSRGASLAVFTDESAQSVDVVKKNLILVGLMEKARVVRSDYSSYLSHAAEKFDIAFLDPPYHKGILQNALEMTVPVMSDYGVILCEHPANSDMPQRVKSFTLARQYRYGKIMISVYRKGDDGEWTE